MIQKTLKSGYAMNVELRYDQILAVRRACQEIRPDAITLQSSASDVWAGGVGLG